MLRTIDGWGTWERLYAICMFLVLLVAANITWLQADPWLRSAAFFSDTVIPLPVRPLTWVTSTPTTESVLWHSGGRGILTTPAGDGPHPALVVTLGADAASPDDPRVVRLVDGLARTGIAVLFPLSDELDAGEITPIEIDRLVGAFELLQGRPRIHSDRIGYLGLSVGGSLAIVSAADERIAADVWMVIAVGPYHDAAALLGFAAAAAYREDGEAVPWDVEDTTREVAVDTLLVTLSEQDRAAIEAGEEPATGYGRLAQRLLQGLTGDALPLREAEAILAALSPQDRTDLEAVSPRYALDSLQAPLRLLHDQNDRFVPWTESEAIAAQHEPEVYHRLELFEHVEPDPGNLPVLFRDGWRLLRMFAEIYDEAN